jgi:hypothetical protein
MILGDPYGRYYTVVTIQNNLTHFPRQVNESTLEFDEWAHRVRHQMMTCLKKRRRENEADSQ